MEIDFVKQNSNCYYYFLNLYGINFVYYTIIVNNWVINHCIFTIFIDLYLDYGSPKTNLEYCSAYYMSFS